MQMSSAADLHTLCSCQSWSNVDHLIQDALQSPGHGEHQLQRAVLQTVAVLSAPSAGLT